MIGVVKNYVFGGLSEFDDPFVIQIDTRNVLPESSAADEFKFPQNPDTLDGYINFMVDWGDGQFSRIRSKKEALVPHKYAVPGIYTISFYKPRVFNGSVIGFRYEFHLSERLKLLKVLRFGRFNSSRSAFYNATNLDLSDVHDSVTTDHTMEKVFANTNITKIKNLSNWKYTGGSEIRDMFQNCQYFNDDWYIDAPYRSYFFRTLGECIRFNGLLTFNTKATSFERLLENNHSFNKPLHNCGINWSTVTNLDRFMTKATNHSLYTPYNPSYYDLLLQALDDGGQTGVLLGFTSKYTSVGAIHRSNLISKGWTINDLGLI